VVANFANDDVAEHTSDLVGVGVDGVQEGLNDRCCVCLCHAEEIVLHMVPPGNREAGGAIGYEGAATKRRPAT